MSFHIGTFKAFWRRLLVRLTDDLERCSGLISMRLRGFGQGTFSVDNVKCKGRDVLVKFDDRL